jgi:hypothetical protein
MEQNNINISLSKYAAEFHRVSLRIERAFLIL